MKISNSKKKLAKIIHENGGWRDGVKLAAQDRSGRVCFYSAKPTRAGGTWWHSDYSNGDWINCRGAQPNWHQTILSRDEYFHLYPAPDADGCIEWGGEHKSPVENGVLVDVKLKSGAYHEGELLDDASWGDAWGDESIIAYRLHKPEIAPAAQEPKPVPEPEAKPTIEQLAADYRKAKECADRKQQEADDAKADADAKLKALEIAGEALGLLVSPINAKQEPELVIEFKVGDEVECVESNIKRDKYNGMVGRLSLIDESDKYTPYLVDFGGAAKIWCHEVKFIRRP